MVKEMFEELEESENESLEQERALKRQRVEEFNNEHDL